MVVVEFRVCSPWGVHGSRLVQEASALAVEGPAPSVLVAVSTHWLACAAGRAQRSGSAFRPRLAARRNLNPSVGPFPAACPLAPGSTVFKNDAILPPRNSQQPPPQGCPWVGSVGQEASALGRLGDGRSPRTPLVASDRLWQGPATGTTRRGAGVLVGPRPAGGRVPVWKLLAESHAGFPAVLSQPWPGDRDRDLVL